MKQHNKKKNSQQENENSKGNISNVLHNSDKRSENPNGTSVFLSVFTNTTKQISVVPTVPKALLLRKRGGMDETNSIKKYDSDSDDGKTNKPGMSDSAAVGARKKSNTACPLTCKCKWKRGKETVQCASKGFKNIPYIKDSGTQVCILNLDY